MQDIEEEEGEEETPEEKEERLKGLHQKLSKEAIIEKVPLIHKIVEERMSDLLEYCFEMGYLPKVDELDKGNQAPLMVAAEKNDIPMVKCLLSHGADANRHQFRPVHICANTSKSGEQVEIMRMLKDAGADLNATQMGGTPLHLAALAGNFLLCKFLMEQRVDRTIRSIRGQTAQEVARAADIKKFIRDFGIRKKKQGKGQGRRFNRAYSPILNKSSKGRKR